MNATTIAHEFFESYTNALLARDSAAIADHYAVPALIIAPGQLLAVSDASQTKDFFENAIGQYSDVTEASPAVAVLAASDHSLWVDVTWSYDGTPAERNVYQLVSVDDQWSIAVLTPRSLQD